jgi:hypothetical protein
MAKNGHFYSQGSNPMGSNGIYRVELITEVDDDTIQGILDVQEQAWLGVPAHRIKWNDDELRNLIKSDDGIVIVVRTNQKVIGFTLSRPYNVAIRELIDDDPQLIASSEPKYYGEQIAILPEFGGKRISFLLTAYLVEVLLARNVKSFAVHVRINRGYNDIMKIMFPNIRFLRTIHNLLNTGEDFEHQEIGICSQDVERIRNMLTT